MDPVEKLHWMTFVDQPKDRIDSFARYLKGAVGWKNIVIWFYTDHTEKRLEDYLNELEYIGGRIWANVYLTDDIVIINPKTGVVTDVIDCKGILPERLRTKTTDVLNGIAQDPSDGSIYITGKYWPKLYKITY